jgi:integral membrane protein
MPDRIGFGAAGHLPLTERVCALNGGSKTMPRVLGYVAIAEAVSFIVLLLAMVVKYGFDEPIGVEIMGPLHGVLFLAFVGLTVIVGGQARWSLSRFAMVLASGVVPLAGWFVGHRLLHESA